MPLTITPVEVPIQLDADGVARVAGSRVTLDTVMAEFLGGATAEEIATSFPTLQLADIYSVIAYYLHRRADIDSYLDERQQQAQEIRREIEARWDPAEFRERLLARRQPRDQQHDPTAG